MKSKKSDKKPYIVPLLLFILLLLGAWGSKPVELLDDSKLIDLNKAIDFARPGGELITPDVTLFTTAVTTEPQVVETEIIISIRGEMISYNGAECVFEDLEDKIRKMSKEHVTFKLVDDFAEAHLYKKILELLRELKEEIQLRYTYE